MKIDVVVGAQYGSEAKGHVTQRLIDRARKNGEWDVVSVRVAGPNAGHTGHTPDGIAIAFRQLPMGALRPGMDCFIAAGSEIEPDVLIDEIDTAIRYADFDPACLFVDENATILTEEHKQVEGGVKLRDRVGSTGKGIGAARADRIMRTAKTVADDHSLRIKLAKLGVEVCNTEQYYLGGGGIQIDRVIIEGTQGYALGLHAGYYPFCTSSDCRAIDFLAMAGLSPWQANVEEFAVWAVARVYPIRVNGNSGPMEGETTWEALGLPPEYTTVTKLERRVGEWDPELVFNAVMANGGAPVVRLAITMLDQKFPELKDADTTDQVVNHEEAFKWLSEVSDYCSARIELVTTGPNSGVWM